MGEDTVALYKIFNTAWNQEKIPFDWEIAAILPIYNKRNNRL